MKITSRHISKNGETILKFMLSGCKLFNNQHWSYDGYYDVNDCSAVIIDTDKAEGKQLWQSLSSDAPPVLKIAYTSIPENQPGNSYYLKKPFRFKELNKLIESLQNSDENSVNNFSIENNHMTTKESFTVIEFILNKCKNKCKIIQLRKEKKTVTIDINQLLCSESISDREIESLLVSDFAKCEIIALENNSNSEGFLHDMSGPFSRAISKKCNEQLLPVLNQECSFKLHRWPNFKKIKYNAAYVQIAVLLNKKYYDMVSVSQICKVSLQEIATFLNICYALNNLEVQENAVANESGTISAEKGKKTAFLKKIRSRLGI